MDYLGIRGTKCFVDFLGNYISADTIFIWAVPIEIFQNLNKIIKNIIRLRPGKLVH